MSNHINLIRGTTQTFAIDLVDEAGNPATLESLEGATAEFLLRVDPDDVSNVLRFTTVDNPTSLAFEDAVAAVDLTFQPTDTTALTLGIYYYQLLVTQKDGNVRDVIPWALFELTLGGSAPVAPPSFDNTVKINHDYPLPGDMTYMTPGGSPIENAQVRVYKKSDYDAGRLDIPVGVTQTDAGGKWKQSILVTTGYTYVARLEKPYEFGVDIKEFFA